MSGNLKFYYKNVTSEVIGCENGITKEQFAALAATVEPIVSKINKDRNNGLTPYRDLPYIQDNLEKVKAFASRIQRQCDNFVVIGAGEGSIERAAGCTLPNLSLYNSDEKERKTPRLLILGNPCPSQLKNLLNCLSGKHDRTVFNVTGSSDNPLTAALSMIISEHLAGQRLKDRLMITTDTANGAFGGLAANIDASMLTFPGETPGLFSTLSVAGLLIAAVCGVDIDAVLAGARAMDVRSGNEDFFRNPAAIYAAVHHYYSLKKPVNAATLCSDAFKNMCSWNRLVWRQCLGENCSESHIPAFFEVKYPDPDDMVIPQCPGISENFAGLCGEKMAALTAAENMAAQYSLIKSGTPFTRMIFDRLDAFSTGQFIYMMEVAASIAAMLCKENTCGKPPAGRVKCTDTTQDINSLTATDSKFLV